MVMAGVAQLVRAPDCDSGGRRFNSGHSPHLHYFPENNVSNDIKENELI